MELHEAIRQAGLEYRRLGKGMRYFNYGLYYKGENTFPTYDELINILVPDQIFGGPSKRYPTVYAIDISNKEILECNLDIAKAEYDSNCLDLSKRPYYYSVWVKDKNGYGVTNYPAYPTKEEAMDALKDKLIHDENWVNELYEKQSKEEKEEETGITIKKVIDKLKQYPLDTYIYTFDGKYYGNIDLDESFMYNGFGRTLEIKPIYYRPDCSDKGEGTSNTGGYDEVKETVVSEDDKRKKEIIDIVDERIAKYFGTINKKYGKEE